MDDADLQEVLRTTRELIRAPVADVFMVFARHAGGPEFSRRDSAW